MEAKISQMTDEERRAFLNEPKKIRMDSKSVKWILAIAACVAVIVGIIIAISIHSSADEYGTDDFLDYDCESGYPSYEEDYQYIDTDYFESFADDFILPYSASQYYSLDELEGMMLNETDTQFAINEIYARRNRDFKDEPYASHFNACEWYYGSIPGDEFDDIVFNDYEKQNIETLVEYADEHGWR